MRLKQGFFGLLVLASSWAMAKTPSASVQKNMQISVDPANLLLGEIPLRYSLGIKPRIALGISAYGRFFAYDQTKSFGFGGGVDAKFNLSGDNFKDSWYVKPGITAGYLSAGNYSAPSIGMLVTAGHGWVWDSGFALDVGLGIGYKHWFIKDSSKVKGFGVNGILPSLDVALGWVF